MGVGLGVVGMKLYCNGLFVSVDDLVGVLINYGYFILL